MYLGDHAAATPDRLALTMWPSGASLTFGELHERSVRLANLFRSAGLVEGDVVAVLAYNHLRYYETAFAAVCAGLYVVPVNAHSAHDEAAYLIGNCGARALVVADSTVAKAEDLVADTPGVELRLTMDASSGSHRAIEEATAGQPATPIAPERRGTFMFYSSGTTGRPKGIKPPLPGADASIGDALLHDGVRRQFRMTTEGVYLSPAPLHHAAPIRTSMAVLEVGARVVCMERFDAEQALAAIEAHGVTVSQWVPTMFVRMLKLDPDVRARYDLSSQQRVVHAAAPCPVWVKEQMIDWWGPIISEYYAGSENIGNTSIESDEWLAHKGSVGRPVYGEIHVCDESGAELPAGHDGIIYFDAPATVFEYHGDPAKTAGIFHPTQNWRTLGDIGHVDADGYLYLSDRSTFMIISGGANVYPQEIEAVLLAHPAVADAAVFGIPHADLGEVPLALVQPVEGAAGAGAAGETLAAELRALCTEKLARYKVPARIEFRDALPRGDDGKLRKKPLRDAYWDEGSHIIQETPMSEETA